MSGVNTEKTTAKGLDLRPFIESCDDDQHLFYVLEKIDSNSDEFLSAEEVAQNLHNAPNLAYAVGKFVDCLAGQIPERDLIQWWQSLASASKKFSKNFDARKTLLPFVSQDPSYSVDTEHAAVTVNGITFPVDYENSPPSFVQLNNIGQAMAMLDPEHVTLMAGKGLLSIRLKIKLIKKISAQKDYYANEGGYRPSTNTLFLAQKSSLETILHDLNHAVADYLDNQGREDFAKSYHYLVCDTEATKQLQKSRSTPYLLWMGLISFFDEEAKIRPHIMEEGARRKLDEINGVLNSYSCASIDEGLAEWHYYSGGQHLDDFFAIAKHRVNRWESLSVKERLALESSLEDYKSSANLEIKKRAIEILNQIPVPADE